MQYPRDENIHHSDIYLYIVRQLFQGMSTHGVSLTSGLIGKKKKKKNRGKISQEKNNKENKNGKKNKEFFLFG